VFLIWRAARVPSEILFGFRAAAALCGGILLSFGQQRFGLLIGDVSGKGIAAALLMANLQANLRSQCALVLAEPEPFLSSVNHLFYGNTVESAYASLFFAEYGGIVRSPLCQRGHPSGLILRSDNTLCRLDTTATLVGLFRDCECTFADFKLTR
jgi:serine phosphatase RsbU (regulator of sigma subunit)